MKNSLLLLILSFVCALSVHAQDPSKIERLSQQYDYALANGDYASAFQNILELYNETHSFESAIILACYFYEGIGTEKNLENTAILYKSVADATQYDPNNELALIMIGFAARQYALMDYSINGRFSAESFKYLLKADEVAEDALAQFFLGYIYMDEGNEFIAPGIISSDTSKAITYLDQSSKRNCIAAMVLMGDIYETAGDKDKAFAYWKRAANTPIFDESLIGGDVSSVLVNPNSKNSPVTVYAQNEAFYRLAKYYMDMNDTDNAIVWARKITYDDPLFLDQKAFCYAANGQKQEAIEIYMHEYELTQETDVIARLAITHYVLWHDQEEALRLLEHIKALGDTRAQQVIDMINSGEY